MGISTVISYHILCSILPQEFICFLGIFVYVGKVSNMLLELLNFKLHQKFSQTFSFGAELMCYNFS